MRALITVTVLGTLLVRPSAAGRPADFTGTWRLVWQETHAPRHQSQVGQFEEPVVIVQTGLVRRSVYERSVP